MADLQQFVMYEEEFQLINKICENLQKQSMAKVVYVVDKNGQLIAATGETDNLDTTSLASLTAGNIAATGGLAKLIGEKEFATQFHEGERDNFHIFRNSADLDYRGLRVAYSARTHHLMADKPVLIAPMT